MKIKKEMLLAYLEKHAMTVSEFAQKVGVPVSEIEKLLNGEAVGKDTAREFIAYLGAYEAQHFVDWVAINKINPFACKTGKGASENDSD